MSNLTLRWSVTIPGEWRPEAKRSFPLPNGRWTRVDSPECKDFKAYVRALVALQKLDDMPWDEPLGMKIIWTRPEPTSARKHDAWPYKRPDLNNLCKLIEDALEKVAYVDDARVCHQVLEKRYGDDWSIEVHIWRLEPDWPYRK